MIGKNKQKNFLEMIGLGCGDILYNKIIDNLVV